MATHRKPLRSFRVIGVVVIVLGALGGLYLTVGRGQHAVSDALLVFDAAPAPAGGDSAASRAADLARQKAIDAAAEASAAVKKANEVAKREAEEASRSGARTSYPAPASCSEYDGNRALGCALLLEAGFGLAEMPCLDRLWTKESHWRVKAENKSSGAYGIPQALHGESMATFGDDWRTNPVTQIKWGLDYIERRYGSPCKAWAHSQNTGWY